MVRKVVFGLALLITTSFSYSVFGEVPYTFLGEWEVDLERTLSAHLKEVMATDPESMNGVDVADLMKSAASADSNGDNKVLFTITDTTITAQHTGSGQYEEMPYRVVSGNSGEIVVELFPTEGEPGITTIRLIEGGLAMSKEDCSYDPEVCLRRERVATKERAMKQSALEPRARDMLEDDPSAATAMISSDPAQIESFPAELKSPPKAVPHISPRWTYLKKRD